MSTLIRLVSLIVLLHLALAETSSAQPPTRHPYAESLIQQALDRELWKHPYWRRLLHYKRHLYGGYESEADGWNFFNSPVGKWDLKAEMAATLRSYFDPPSSVKDINDHPLCSYPARYKWLNNQLQIDRGRLPDVECPVLDDWLKRMDPDRVTLVFASFYMSNPASMFGHTLLRIDSKQKGPGQELLSYGVNYAGNPDTDNVLLYSFKGLAGYFPGTFSVFPYFVKVQEYNNWESRDLWEYELNLTHDHIDNLLLHLWELGNTYFDYFYLTENCSFHMLTILEVANPELDLTSGFFISVQPVDTLKAVMAQKGLVGKVSYRPAILNQMKNITARMSSEEKDILYDVVEDPEALKKENYQNLEIPRKALILDAYLDYLQYKGMQKKKKTDPDKSLNIPHAILLERSKLKYKSQDGDPIRFSTRPETAHGTDRARLGIGFNDDELFQEIGYRPTLHDIMGREAGYNKDSQFIFFDFLGRWLYESERFRLEKFKLIDIISMTPYEPIFAKPSWKLNMGFDSIRDFKCDHCNNFQANGGYGYSYKHTYSAPYLLYALAEVDAETSGTFDENYRLGGGASTGALINFSEDWRMQLQAMYKRFPLGDSSEFFRYDARLRYSPHKDVDLRLEYMRVDHKDQGVFSLNIYF